MLILKLLHDAFKITGLTYSYCNFDATLLHLPFYTYNTNLD